MRKAVILSLDAMFDADLSHYAPDSDLQQWLKQACMCSQVKTVFPALTYPAHVTLMTGCQPASHGVVHNLVDQPGVQHEMRSWYWDAALVQRPTLMDAVKQAGGRVASMLWPVTGKSKSIRWNFPEVLALPGENQVLKMLQYGSAPWIMAMEWKHGKERVSIHEPHLSDYAITLTEDVLRRHQPELTCAHLVDLDETRHHHGVYNEEVRQALHRNEQRVMHIWNVMQSTPGMEDALMILVSDHGQADVSRAINLEKVLQKAGLYARVEPNAMSAYVYAPQQKEKVMAWLRDHATAAGVQHIYSREELDALGAAPEVDFAVEAAPGVMFSDHREGPTHTKATHGFGPGHPAENCLFAVRGKGIRAGAVLPGMPMRDVAPTIAGLMGVPMPTAEGVDHSAEMLQKPTNV